MGVLQAAAAGIRQCIGIKKERSGHEATRLRGDRRGGERPGGGRGVTSSRLGGARLGGVPP